MDVTSGREQRAVRLAFETDRHAASMLAQAYQRLLAQEDEILPSQSSVQNIAPVPSEPVVCSEVRL